MSIHNDILKKIIEELEKARKVPPCGLTITELSKRLKVSRTVIRIHLVALETKGIVECVRVQKASIYYLKEKDKY